MWVLKWPTQYASSSTFIQDIARPERGEKRRRKRKKKKSKKVFCDFLPGEWYFLESGGNNMPTLKRIKKLMTHEMLKANGLQVVNSNYSASQKEIILQLALNKVASKTGQSVDQVFNVLKTEMWRVQRRCCNKATRAKGFQINDRYEESRGGSLLHSSSEGSEHKEDPTDLSQEYELRNLEPKKPNDPKHSEDN